VPSTGVRNQSSIIGFRDQGGRQEVVFLACACSYKATELFLEQQDYGAGYHFSRHASGSVAHEAKRDEAATLG
jgi:hypothetical protein